MVRLWLALAAVVAAMGVASRSLPAAPAALAERTDDQCTRDSLSVVINQFIASVQANDASAAPMADIYKATENSHGAAITMMTLWRTSTKIGTPSLVALDTTNCTAYFAMDFSEGNDAKPSVLRVRIAVKDNKIYELEQFINRSRGDHGFSFEADELAANYAILMSPPADRINPSRETLWELSESIFAATSPFNITFGDTCQFTELGWRIVDPGPWGNGSLTPLGCIIPPQHPVDTKARVALVVDEEMGFVVMSGIVPGKAFPYGNVSAFIPDDLSDAQAAQVLCFQEAKAMGYKPLPDPIEATGDTLEVLQYYNNALQALQINVYLNGPNMTSPWL